MTSLVCVDASIILRALLPHEETTIALDMLAHWQEHEVTLVASALLTFEVVSTLRRAVFQREIPAAAGDTAFYRFRQMEIHYSNHPQVFAIAWELSKQFNRPRAYDTTYLALAQLQDCSFWTADKRLFNAVSAHLSWVHWIGNFTADNMPHAAN